MAHSSQHQPPQAWPTPAPGLLDMDLPPGDLCFRIASLRGSPCLMGKLTINGHFQ